MQVRPSPVRRPFVETTVASGVGNPGRVGRRQPARCELDAVAFHVDPCVPPLDRTACPRASMAPGQCPGTRRISSHPRSGRRGWLNRMLEALVDVGTAEAAGALDRRGPSRDGSPPVMGLSEALGDQISGLGAKLHPDEGVEAFWIGLDSQCFYDLVPCLVVARIRCGDDTDSVRAGKLSDVVDGLSEVLGLSDGNVEHHAGPRQSRGWRPG